MMDVVNIQSIDDHMFLLGMYLELIHVIFDLYFEPTQFQPNPKWFPLKLIVLRTQFGQMTYRLSLLHTNMRGLFFSNQNIKTEICKLVNVNIFLFAKVWLSCPQAFKKLFQTGLGYISLSDLNYVLVRSISREAYAPISDLDDSQYVGVGRNRAEGTHAEF